MSRADSPLRGTMIFAVGARRSGTNWLQRVLAAHPDVVAVPSETYLFSHGLRPLRERFQQGALSSTATGSVYVDRDTMLDAMRDLCDAVFAGLLGGLDPGASRLVERTPDHVRHLDLIGEIYPDSHVIHIIRDGRDVVRSLLSHDWGPSDAAEAAHEWRTAIESARAAAPALERYHEVSYERMLGDPRSEIAQLFALLGLAAEGTELDAVLTEAGVRYNADPTSGTIRAAKWRTDLDPAIVEVVEGEAGHLLAELGYGLSHDMPPVPATSEPEPEPVRSRSLRRRLRRATSPPFRQAVETAQQVLDAFLDRAANDPSGVLALLAPHVRVRIVDGTRRLDTRGEEAKRRLIDELRSDEALRGRQLVGYVHPSTPSVTFVGQFGAGGATHPRVFVLALDRGKIERVSYYRFAAIPSSA